MKDEDIVHATRDSRKTYDVGSSHPGAGEGFFSPWWKRQGKNRVQNGGGHIEYIVLCLSEKQTVHILYIYVG